MKTRGTKDIGWTHETKVMISGKPRDPNQKKRLDDISPAADHFGNHVIMDISSIHKARLGQLQEQFKQAVDKIENEANNLESLKVKKTKLRNKLLDIYQFLLKNPPIIL